MADIATLPAPADDSAALADAIAMLRSSAEEILFTESARLSTVGASASAQWAGEAAGVFREHHGTVLRAVNAVGEMEGELALQLTRYHQSTAAAHATVQRAQALADGALRDYAGAASRAASGLANSLENMASQIWSDVEKTLETATHFVAHLFSDPSGAAQRGSWMSQSLQSWSSPLLGVDLQAVAPESVVLPGRSEIEYAVHTYGGLAVSGLLGGVEEFFHWAGGEIHHAVSWIKTLEHELVSTLHTAWTIAVEALEELARIGLEVARSVAGIVRQAVTMWLPFLAGFAISAVFRDLMPSQHTGLSGSQAASADERAAEHFASSSVYQKQVDTMRLLSDYAYRDSGAPPGWTRGKSFRTPDGGYAVLFRNPGPPPQEVLAFRGSSDVGDWFSDGLNFNGAPTLQAVWAIELAKQLKAEYGSSLSITGHSLGGSLAAIASMSSGAPATTFNAANVGQANYDLVRELGTPHPTQTQIVDFSTRQDVVTDAQGGIDSPAAGAHVVMNATQGETDPAKAHNLSSFDWTGYAHADGDTASYVWHSGGVAQA